MRCNLVGSATRNPRPGSPHLHTHACWRRGQEEWRGQRRACGGGAALARRRAGKSEEQQSRGEKEKVKRRPVIVKQQTAKEGIAGLVKRGRSEVGQ